MIDYFGILQWGYWHYTLCKDAFCITYEHS